MNGWAVWLNGVLLDGGDPEGWDPEVIGGCLTRPPEGLGVPPLRVEDQSFPQRDGVAHYADWYDARIITLEGVSISSDDCPGCPSARIKAASIMGAWSRHCGDTELVIFTDCFVSPSVSGREITGPFGVKGRPRQADIRWLGDGSKAAEANLRFDSVDHRLYILDEEGTPGSGTECSDLDPVISTLDYAAAVIAASGANDNYWQLDEASGFTVANSGAGAGGTYIGLTSYRQPPITPGLGPSVITTRVDLPLGGATRTITYWTRTAEHYWTNGATYSFAFDNVQWGTHSFAPNATLVDKFHDGLPHFWAIRHNTTTNVLTIYVDDVLIQSTGAMPTTPPAITGTLEFWSGEGTISDVATWDTEQTTGTLSTLYDAAGNTSEEVTVSGNVCVPMEITFTGPLENPKVWNDAGNFVGLDLTFAAADPPVPANVVILNTETGTATTEQGSDVTYAISGNPFLTLDPGVNILHATTDSGAGDIDVCWRPAVVSG